jgi:hypothetical protein
MLIRGNPDFLILPFTGPLAGRKRSMGLKPEVQRLWKASVNRKLGTNAGNAALR